MMKVAGNSEDKKLKKYGVNELRRMFLEFFGYEELLTGST